VDLSPILVRPVREQLEHDRVIRLLQAKYKRKFEVAINPGTEQSAPVGSPESPWYPDLVLQTADKNRKLAGVVEVESAESVNHLEAMSQWKAFSALRVPFHLYLPVSSIDTARRFCADMGIPVAEMWTYQAVGDQIRFALIHRTAQADDGKGAGAVETEPAAEPRAAKPGAAKPPAAKPPAAKPAAAKAAAARPTTGPAAAKPGAARSSAGASRNGAAARPAARGATATRAASPARARGNGAAAHPSARRAPAAAARPAAKPKAAAARRPAAKPAAAARKTKAAPASRAQKRR
jgi:hypothetical protein